jgi:hypothetical protein
VSALKALAVLVFIGMAGLALATLLVSRGPVPAEVSGSPIPPEFPWSTVDAVLDDGGFVTRVPDGEAYATLRYGSAQAFSQLVHTYRSRVTPEHRIVAAVIETSDDGANWTEAGKAENDNGELIFDLAGAGSHTFWKLLVVRSGGAPDVVFGQLTFATHGYTFLRTLPLDVVWLGLMPASALMFMAFRLPVSMGRLFLAAAVPAALFLAIYSLGYVEFRTVISPDSFGYLGPVLYGHYSPLRNIGYPSMLLALQNTVGLDRLAWVQLGAGIACYFAGAWLLAARFKRKWIAVLLALAFLLQGSLSRYAPHLLTEALFMAGFGLFAAALGVLAWRRATAAVVAAAVGIALMTLTKTLGVVVVLPALLLVRFLPTGTRLSTSGVIVASGLATYALMAISSYARTGAASPESYMGYQLIGNVGWMLDDTSMPPSGLTREMINAAATVTARRPADLADIDSLASLDRYVDITEQDFDPVLWGNLVPIANTQLATAKEVDSFFLRFSLSSIRAHPLAYMRHVAAHFYGMWRDLGRALPLRYATMDFRRQLIFDGPPEFDPRQVPASVVKPYPDAETVKADIFRQSKLPLMLGQVWSANPIGSGATIALGTLSVFLTILFFIPGQLTRIYRTEIMIALSLNAYFGAHVLLHVTDPRYASGGIFAAIFLAASFAFTTLSICPVPGWRTGPSP